MNTRPDPRALPSERAHRSLEAGRVPLLLTLILGACSVGGCDSAGESRPSDAPKEWTVTELDTVVSLASELLAVPGDLSVASDGDLYVADVRDSRILRIPQGQGAPVTIGSQGQGPVEFDTPVAIVGADDTLRVVEQGNGRVQVLDSEGNCRRSFPLPASPLGGFDILGDGCVAAATMGFRSEALVLLFDLEGQLVDSLAEPVVPPHSVWDVRAMQSQIAAGELPSSLRNWAQPVLNPDGGTWVVLVADGSIRRFDAAGNLLWSRPLEAPELPAIEEEFFESNAELKGQAAFVPLSYVADAEVVDKRLWILLNSPPDAPSVVLILDGEGVVRGRVVLPAVQRARSIAVDGERRRLYLSLPSEATILVAALPAALVQS